MAFRKSKKKAGGLTLIELMMGMAITAMIGLGISTYLSYQQATVKQIESNLRMTTIARQVERAISNVKVLTFSVQNSNQPGNNALFNCIRTTQSAIQAGTSCTTTNAQAQQSFDLILPIYSPGPFSAAQLDQNTIAGHDFNIAKGPSHYQLADGVHCSRLLNVLPATCNISVRAFFWATCPPGSGASSGQASFAPSQCPAAQSIHLHYQVSYTPSGAAGSTGTFVLKMDNVPDDRVFYANGVNGKPSTSGAMTLAVNAFPVLAVPAPTACPTNATATSVVNGEPICTCMYPFQPVAGCIPGVTAKNCACTDNKRTCSPDTRYRGIDLSGNIICCPVYCEQLNIDPLNPMTGCKQGGWVESIEVPQQTPPMSWTQLFQYWMQFGTLPPPSLPPDLKCSASTECKIGKWGGTCQMPVTCNEAVKCCYDYVPAGSPGTFGACNSGS